MSRTHIVGGIVHYGKKHILLEGVGSEMRLPRIKIPVGLNAKQELKDEIEKEFLINLRFHGSLSDSWSRLLMLHAGATSDFVSYYIYTVHDSDPEESYWYSLDEIRKIKLNDDDKAALEYFLEIDL